MSTQCRVLQMSAVCVYLNMHIPVCADSVRRGRVRACVNRCMNKVHSHFPASSTPPSTHMNKTNSLPASLKTWLIHQCPPPPPHFPGVLPLSATISLGHKRPASAARATVPRLCTDSRDSASFFVECHRLTLVMPCEMGGGGTG